MINLNLNNNPYLLKIKNKKQKTPSPSPASNHPSGEKRANSLPPLPLLPSGSFSLHSFSLHRVPSPSTPSPSIGFKLHTPKWVFLCICVFVVMHTMCLLKCLCLIHYVFVVIHTPSFFHCCCRNWGKIPFGTQLKKQVGLQKEQGGLSLFCYVFFALRAKLGPLQPSNIGFFGSNLPSNVIVFGPCGPFVMRVHWKTPEIKSVHFHRVIWFFSVHVGWVNRHFSAHLGRLWW